MRLLLSLFALLAMLANPATAAAKAGCSDARPAACSSMKMPGMAMAPASAGSHQMAIAPCGGPAPSNKPMSGKACAQACGAVAVVAVATIPQDQGALLTYALAALTPSPSAIPRAHEPNRLDRPPKYIA